MKEKIKKKLEAYKLNIVACRGAIQALEELLKEEEETLVKEPAPHSEPPA